MLVQLIIKNFAIIDDLDIRFEDGMTALTGETGSGKSIIIDAIGLVLGERAQQDMIRHDKEQAIIEAAFHYTHPKISELLEQFGIEEDELLILYREINKSGRTICRINGSLVTVNQLKQIAQYLVDIHVQHDTTKLIHADNYLYIIDALADTTLHAIKAEYQANYSQYRELQKKYEHLLAMSQTNQAELEFYKYQLQELKQANISVEEYNELQERRHVIANYDKIFEHLNLAYMKIRENQSLETLYEAGMNLSKIADVNETYKELADQFFNYYYQLEDMVHVLSEEVAKLDYDPEELDQIESRLSVYSQLKRKYREEVEDLVRRMEELEEKIASVDHFEDRLSELDRMLRLKYEETYRCALKLREERIALCETIKDEVISHLQDLKLENTMFEIVFNEITERKDDYLKGSVFNADGIDTVEFYLSFNIGEPVKPLSKVASGGELSRFMLALKTVLMHKQHLSTMIFDEIDTGVSGLTASAIAKKIKAISNEIQVLCITHLPQVAAIADQHLLIYKEERDHRTHTRVQYLEGEARVHEIAKMMAGESVDDIALENAKNLLKAKA